MRELLRRLLSSWPVLRVLEVVDRRTENRMTEFGMIAQAFEFKKINKVEGDYFEFGLWRGKTFLYAHTMKRRYGLKDTFLRGFDSFKGLPPHRNTADNIWHEGQFAFSEAELRKTLKSKGVREGEFELVKGFYNQSLNEELDRRLQGVKAAIVYIDCDLYESTCTVLQWVKKYLVNGSIVCFDDYYNNRGATDQGEARALQEFIEANPDIRFISYFDYSPLGKSFIVRLD
ncbi:methyltransferase [Nitrosococcus halophilus Nc 4]|uniref:Methyltransferase n=1 Tax=Nitrosococcus halophilus (strain Nc4) TaxID=472759 RepID=D5C028_NITHN|nr:TylF/MycF/NovP-related O-methyltransferase [Nitrosococcus halophilus]ADE16275.1 methyltransferase [Nitrosococcus halophilus Nc 4]